MTRAVRALTGASLRDWRRDPRIAVFRCREPSAPWRISA
jgi:hypothetical protein